MGVYRSPRVADNLTGGRAGIPTDPYVGNPSALTDLRCEDQPKDNSERYVGATGDRRDFWHSLDILFWFCKGFQCLRLARRFVHNDPMDSAS